MSLLSQYQLSINRFLDNSVSLLAQIRNYNIHLRAFLPDERLFSIKCGEKIRDNYQKKTKFPKTKLGLINNIARIR